MTGTADDSAVRTIGITGCGGLLGTHLRALLRSRGKSEVIPIPSTSLTNEEELRALVSRCDVVVHLACLIRGSDDEISTRNRDVANALTKALHRAGRRIHLLFASSTQIDRDTAYGRSKKECDALFAAWAKREDQPFTSLVLPNVFGEGGKPFHNSVVSTFCHQLANGQEPTVLNDADMELLHAQDAAQLFANAMDRGLGGQDRIPGARLRVRELLALLKGIDRDYRSMIVPDLSAPLNLSLFNTYRSYLFPSFYPVPLKLREDARGSLFEALKARQGGQVFFSTTRPGVTRGNHFHLRKVERFCVASGSATISIRRLFQGETNTFEVRGDAPTVVDIPTLHTHNITNTGSTDLLTLFWANEIFDPERPDTFAEPVTVAP